MFKNKIKIIISTLILVISLWPHWNIIITINSIILVEIFFNNTKLNVSMIYIQFE